MIAETLGGAFLGAFLQVLFDRLATRRFLDFFKKREFSESILERLNITLLTINSVLVDAEEKQITNQAVQKWVNELKDAIYHAEDVLDQIATEALRSNVEAESSMGRLRHLRGKIPLGEMFNRSLDELETKLDKITQRLELLADQKLRLGLKEVIGVKPITTLPTTSLVDESDIIGRDGDKEEILRFLVPENAKEKERDISVVAIVGLGGVGKTALAQILYNDMKVKEEFKIRAWAYVSEEFDVFKITRTIYESVTSQHCSFTDLNVLQVKLQEKLNNKKKFLLVLDDLWSENFINWDLLSRPLKAAATGSRIIVTTRSQRVASIMRAVLTHPLQPLSDEYCWSVFTKHISEGKNIKLNQKLGGIAEKIVMKCQGLPLAAKTLGGLLHSEVKVEEWERVLNSKIWDLPPDKSNILPVLQVSYYFLPAYLKQCFAYCSIFPKGYEFEKEKIVLLWMAEGFLQRPEGKKRMEDLGHGYFSQLVSRSFFQQKTSSHFTMHDFINDLAQYAAGEFCFKYEDGESQKLSERARHFSFLRDRYDAPVTFEGLLDVKYLRTFLPLSLSKSTRSCCLDKMVTDKILPNLSSLRVLSLSHYKITKLTDIFHNLKYIRYLDLSYTEIEKLPESVSCLYNLETVVVSYCPNLSALPADTYNLINLRSLDVTATRLREMPRKFGRLTNLQTLTTFVVGNGGSQIRELADLVQLHGKLSILELQNIENVDDAETAQLSNKKYLKEIVFKWNTNVHDHRREREVLKQLQPHQNIEIIAIHKYGGVSFPFWLGDPSFSNIVCLRLIECENCENLPTLGNLSALRELHISKMNGLRSIGSEFYYSGLHWNSQTQPFRSLQGLWFYDMPDWETWLPSRVPGVHFPSLRHLHLWKCPKLTGNLPNCLPAIETIHIHECRNLDLDFQPQLGIRAYNYETLKQLSLRNSCDSLVSFPLDYFSNLEDIQILKCSYLRSIEILNDNSHGLRSLLKLSISECHNFMTFPESGLMAPNLQKFSVSRCRALSEKRQQTHTILDSLPRACERLVHL